MIQTSPGQ